MLEQRDFIPTFHFLLQQASNVITGLLGVAFRVYLDAGGPRVVYVKQWRFGTRSKRTASGRDIQLSVKIIEL